MIHDCGLWGKAGENPKRNNKNMQTHTSWFRPLCTLFFTSRSFSFKSRMEEKLAAKVWELHVWDQFLIHSSQKSRNYNTILDRFGLYFIFGHKVVWPLTLITAATEASGRSCTVTRSTVLAPFPSTNHWAVKLSVNWSRGIAAVAVVKPSSGSVGVWQEVWSKLSH